MAKETLYTLADFDIVSNVTEDPVLKYENPPSFYFENTLSPYMLKDMGRIHNEVYKMYIQSSDINNIDFMILFGCDDIGNGYAVHIDALDIKVVELVAYNVTNTLSSKPHFRMTINNTWFFVEIHIANKKLDVFLTNKYNKVSNVTNFIPVGNYFGYKNIISANSVNANVSDTMHYTDQILWGNINVNGDGLDTSDAVLFEETTFSFIYKYNCDQYGDWAIFVDEEATDQTRHILLGLVNTERNIQAKGILGITI